jgi:putative transposase
MTRARFSEEQIIGILKAAEAAGNIREVCRENNLTEQTFYHGDASMGAWTYPRRRSFGSSSGRTPS